MTVLHPCHNCHRKPSCEIRTKTLAGIKGLGITKATVRCKIPEQDFPPGSVVDVDAFELDPDGSGYGMAKTLVTCRGVVRGWYNRKAVVVIDKADEITQPSDGPIGYLKVTPDRLKATDLPPVELCKCGLSQERCEANDYPSVRSGQFECQERAIENLEAQAQREGWY